MTQTLRKAVMVRFCLKIIYFKDKRVKLIDKIQKLYRNFCTNLLTKTKKD